ncbi:hypothetical protein BCV69DRAFT_300395 [Microstroma glucosiphilum]|uniref:Uncharacterized protein n=1 Tax=Pseudomicrostroma glucosiphilum TaxID=1684307 RepID=A0A316U9A7_9BASI|nr:hypothetical protein BCV69DRAFT_300395 [Pseudomicrostroma glucosiphilum]PWN19575.1 hypothetical protein BCV69DRAFT_300395 [Pseudomicrostroma glucosiphilum]
MSMPPPPVPLTPKRSAAQRAASVRPEAAPINVDNFSPRRASVPPQSIPSPSSLGAVLLNTPPKIKAEVVERPISPSTPSPSRHRVTPSPSPSPSRRRRSPSVTGTSTLGRAISRSRLSPSPGRFKSPGLLSRRSISRSLSASPRSRRAGTVPASPYVAAARSRVLRASATPSPQRPHLPSALPLSSPSASLGQGSNATVVPSVAPLQTILPSREPTPAHLVDRNRGRLPSDTPGPVNCPPPQGQVETSDVLAGQKRKGKRRKASEKAIVLDSSSSSSDSDSEMEVLPAPVTFAASRSRSLSLVPPSITGTSASMQPHLAEEDNHECTIEVHVLVKGPNGDAIARVSYQRQAHLGPQRCFNSRQNEVLDREAPKTARRLEHELRKVRRQG